MGWLVDATNETITQGSVIDGIQWGLEPNPLGIVLSNPCDLEWGNASYLLVASLIPAKKTIQISKEYQQKVENFKNNELSKSKWKSFSNYFTQFVNNQNIIRYFFINPTKVIKAPLFFVDFQHIITIPIDKKDTLETVAKLPSPFREKMIMHFSSYISRLGLDRENMDELDSLITDLADPYYMAP